MGYIIRSRSRSRSRAGVIEDTVIVAVLEATIDKVESKTVQSSSTRSEL